MSDIRLHAARRYIEALDMAPSAYRLASADELAAAGARGEGLAHNEVFLRGELSDLSLTVHGSGTGNRLFLNPGLGGEISIGLTGHGGQIHFGRDVTLRGVHIGSRQDNDFIAIGNAVASTGPGRWVSGLRAGPAAPGLIIGDCCVLSSDVVLRNSDGHPIFDAGMREQRNTPRGNLLIEPHVWLGERSAVLKDVTVGAFSIIGFGSVVSRDIPRHHSATGSPAHPRPLRGRVWAWDETPAGRARARYWLQRFPVPGNGREGSGAG